MSEVMNVGVMNVGQSDFAAFDRWTLGPNMVGFNANT